LRVEATGWRILSLVHGVGISTKNVSRDEESKDSMPPLPTPSYIVPCIDVRTSGRKFPDRPLLSLISLTVRSSSMHRRVPILHHKAPRQPRPAPLPPTSGGVTRLSSLNPKSLTTKPLSSKPRILKSRGFFAHRPTVPCP
jgi:hypothetical protein